MADKHQVLMVRVTADQKKRARNLVDAHGFTSISQLVRSTLFERDLFRENKIDKIYEAICNKYDPTKLKRNPTTKKDPLYDVKEDPKEPYQAELYMN